MSSLGDCMGCVSGILGFDFLAEATALIEGEVEGKGVENEKEKKESWECTFMETGAG